jgi:hypothetical protein
VVARRASPGNPASLAFSPLVNSLGKRFAPPAYGILGTGRPEKEWEGAFMQICPAVAHSGLNTRLSRRAALTIAAPFLNLRAQNKQDRPNILWILGDDLGIELGCYGHRLVQTPQADRIAAEGVRFTDCHTTAPVCSPSRSAWNTGVYQTTTGAHNHRSHRKDGFALPEGIRLVSYRLADAGYFTANVTGMAPELSASGKTDFNFHTEKPFHGTHWNQRAAGQPFYAQINFTAPHKGPMWPRARQTA